MEIEVLSGKERERDVKGVNRGKEREMGMK